MANKKKPAATKAPVSELPLFYKKVVPLHKETHSELYIDTIENYLFTKSTNSVYIAAVEFLRAANDYPIVFAIGQDNNVFPVVLLGLEQNSNLFINKKGEWDADYVPAYVRRYPFILATDDKERFTVCIDESFPGFNTAKEGKALFDDKGEYGTILSQAVDFLQDYQKHVHLTTLFCKNLQTLDLLEPMQASFSLPDGQSKQLGGFMGVNREKLKALKPEQLSDMVNSDQLELIYSHLASLENIKTLVNRSK